MGVFKQVDGDSVILQSRGVFTQAELYERDGELYAKISGGFVRLYKSGGTSKDKVSIVQIISDINFHEDKFGRLCAPGTGKELPAPEHQKLIGNSNG